MGVKRGGNDTLWILWIQCVADFAHSWPTEVLSAHHGSYQHGRRHRVAAASRWTGSEVIPMVPCRVVGGGSVYWVALLLFFSKNSVILAMSLFFSLVISPVDFVVGGAGIRVDVVCPSSFSSGFILQPVCSPA